MQLDAGTRRQRIAVIGTGISGMSAAWLLGTRHDVTVYEQDRRIGGHCNTVSVAAGGPQVAVDTGFIVYNETTYPNLTALFRHLGVATAPSDMSFACSLDNGALEYCATDLAGLFAQRRNLASRRFWAMLYDLQRFYRHAPGALARLDGTDATLGDYLVAEKYGAAFRDDHLLPMAAAIWSASARDILAYPAAAFIRFCDNHGLLRFRDRPAWRTVCGGSRAYVERITASYRDRIRAGTGVAALCRHDDRVEVRDRLGGTASYDAVVVATHADQALALLTDPSPQETALLGAFRYRRNEAVLHTDAALMPQRRAVWASWNYLTRRGAPGHDVAVSYWMNRLQPIATATDLFVTLNPPQPPRAETILHTESYHHPGFDPRAVAAQRALWSLQGVRRTFFCGSYFGAGFHEDGLQAGLAAAEAVGGVRRPWTVADESSRIVLAPPEHSGLTRSLAA